MFTLGCHITVASCSCESETKVMGFFYYDGFLSSLLLAIFFLASQHVGYLIPMFVPKGLNDFSSHIRRVLVLVGE